MDDILHPALAIQNDTLLFAELGAELELTDKKDDKGTTDEGRQGGSTGQSRSNKIPEEDQVDLNTLQNLNPSQKPAIFRAPVYVPRVSGHVQRRPVPKFRSGMVNLLEKREVEQEESFDNVLSLEVQAVDETTQPEKTAPAVKEFKIQTVSEKIPEITAPQSVSEPAQKPEENSSPEIFVAVPEAIIEKLTSVKEDRVIEITSDVQSENVIQPEIFVKTSVKVFTSRPLGNIVLPKTVKEDLSAETVIPALPAHVISVQDAVPVPVTEIKEKSVTDIIAPAAPVTKIADVKPYKAEAQFSKIAKSAAIAMTGVLVVAASFSKPVPEKKPAITNDFKKEDVLIAAPAATAENTDNIEQLVLFENLTLVAKPVVTQEIQTAVPAEQNHAQNSVKNSPATIMETASVQSETPKEIVAPQQEPSVVPAETPVTVPVKENAETKPAVQQTEIVVKQTAPNEKPKMTVAFVREETAPAELKTDTPAPQPKLAVIYPVKKEMTDNAKQISRSVITYENSPVDTLDISREHNFEKPALLTTVDSVAKPYFTILYGREGEVGTDVVDPQVNSKLQIAWYTNMDAMGPQPDVHSHTEPHYVSLWDRIAPPKLTA